MIRHLASLLVTSSLLCTALFSPLTQAEKVYRWVDENGQTHFSSQPPRSLNEDVYRFRVDEAAEAPKVNAEQDEQDAKKTTATAAVSVELPESVDAAAAEKYCQQSRTIINQLSVNHARRFKQDDGSYRPYSDSERNALIKQAREAISTYCSQ